MRQSYQKGEVVDVDLGKPQKEVKGHEQAFYRPCVIITSFNNLELAVIVPCTTKKPRYSLYTNVKLPKGSGGLSSTSYVLCHQIRTVSFDRINKRRKRLGTKEILKIHSVLSDTLDL